MKRKPKSDDDIVTLQSVIDAIVPVIQQHLAEALESKDRSNLTMMDGLVKDNQKRLLEQEQILTGKYETMLAKDLATARSQAELDRRLHEFRTEELQKKLDKFHFETRANSRKTRNRKEQLRLYQEKLELMKTWKGIFRTTCQKFGVWK